ncbi:MAG: hypothetical protein AMXMBFR56_76850 [Polyangiaceae bacterium]
MPNYPDRDGFAFSFSRAEIDIGGRLFMAIKNITHSQKLEEGVVQGASSEPLARTDGSMGMGEANIEWGSVEEHDDFLAHLAKQPGGPGYMRKLFPILVIYTSADGTRTRKVELESCRVLDSDENAATGPDPVEVSTPISFMRRKINGLRAL